MNRTGLLPHALAVPLAGLALVVSGCGGGSPAAAPTPTPTPATAAPTPTPVQSPAPSRSPTPSPTPTAHGGNGDSTTHQKPATAGGGVCGHLSAATIGASVGATVRGSALSGQTGCVFQTADGVTVTVTVTDQTSAAAGGMAGAKNTATSAVEGDPEDVAGIGDAAFVVTGTMFGEPAIAGAGAVQVGSRILSVDYSQHTGAGRPKVRTTVISLLKALAGAA